MTEFISLMALIYLFISFTCFIFKKEITDVQAIWATALCLILIGLINLVYEATRL